MTKEQQAASEELAEEKLSTGENNTEGAKQIAKFAKIVFCQGFEAANSTEMIKLIPADKLKEHPLVQALISSNKETLEVIKALCEVPEPNWTTEMIQAGVTGVSLTHRTEVREALAPFEGLGE